MVQVCCDVPRVMRSDHGRNGKLTAALIDACNLKQLDSQKKSLKKT